MTTDKAVALCKTKREIERLRAWIAEEGERTNTCTKNVLGNVCENCRCGKAARPNDQGNQPTTGTEVQCKKCLRKCS